MSIREYLNQLDYDQLQNAFEIIDERLRKKDNEGNITLWVVCDDRMNYAAFREDQYMEAVERLCTEIRDDAAGSSGHPISFRLERARVRESEVDEMLELNNG